MNIDHTHITEISSMLLDTDKAIHDMADEAGIACQVKALASDRRKNLLAKYVTQTPFNLPMSQRESMARVIPEYQAEFEELASQLKTSEQIIKRDNALEKRFEAYRSLLSQSKKIMRDLNG